MNNKYKNHVYLLREKKYDKKYKYEINFTVVFLYIKTRKKNEKKKWKIASSKF